MHLRSFSILLAICATPCSGAALEERCTNGMFATDNPEVGLGIITQGKPVSVTSDIRYCSNAGCPELPSGRKVITGRTVGQFICVYIYHYGKSDLTGWVDAARVQSLAINPNPPQTAWSGRWSSYGNPILRLYMRDGKLMAKGAAAWPGLGMTRAELREVGLRHVYSGEIDEPLQVSGNRAHAPECNVTFTLLGDYIVGADPTPQCGGANVYFSGVYRRVR